MKEQTSIVLMNFSGIYEEERFWKEKQMSWIDARDICGTNCYCDDEAIAEINKRTESHSFAGIHFIDSGNYHYMTKLWLEKIEIPFVLLVYDNHTDMQPPAFGGILSCGGWITASLEELKNLKHVILIGPDEAAYEQVEETLKEKVTLLSREKLQEMDDAKVNRFLMETVVKVCSWGQPKCEQNDYSKTEELLKNFSGEGLPLYISIDKDVLCPEDAQTTWSQGDMHLETLLSSVKTVLKCAKETGGKIVGVDICGEADVEATHENEANDLANDKLLEILQGYLKV